MDANKNRTNQTPDDTGCLPASASPRHGFTLVEMLTVIIIIGILAGLIVAAVVPAIRRAREFTIRQDIAQLEMALEKYKQERGDFPPDFAGVNDTDITIRTAARQEVIRHLRKAFPRFRLTGATVDDQWNNLRLLVQQASTQDTSLTLATIDTNDGTDINDLTPGSAIVFCLGGPTDVKGDGSSKLLGFSANPANPFAIGGSRVENLYDGFDETRLLGTDAGGEINPQDGIVELVPPHVSNLEGGNPPPYVYFRARSNGYIRNNNYGGDKHNDNQPYVPLFSDIKRPEIGTCAPYAGSSDIDSSGLLIFRWKNPKTFQIISSGLDGHFGENPSDPATNGTVRFLNGDEANILPEEDDNITSFTEGKLADRAEE